MTTLTRRAFGILGTSAIAGTIAGGGSAEAETGRPPDVVVFCDPTLKPLVLTLGARWREESGVRSHVFCTRSDIFLEQIWRGARCDLAIIEGEALADTAAKRALINPETRASAWRNRLVVAAAQSSGAPVRLAADTNLRQLLGGGRLALADAALTPAGAATRAALESLGFWPSLASDSIGVENTGAVAFLLAQGRAALGIVQQSDLAAVPGLKAVATVPDDSYPPIYYVLAQSTSMLTPAAPRFQAFMRSAPAAAAIAAAGLEVLR